MWGRPTLGELFRRLEAMDRTNQASFKALDDRISRDLVGRAEYNVAQKGQDDRLDDLEDRDTSTLGYRRALLVGVVVAMLSSVGSWIALAIHVT